MLTGLENALKDQPVAAAAALFLAGVATSLTPCIYPMIPITAGILGGSGAAAARSRGRSAALTLSYVLGLALVYSLLGLLAGLTGNLFGTVSSSPWSLFVMGNLLLVFGLALLDVFTIAVPAWISTRISRIDVSSVPGVFLLGASSGLVAAPCGAPAFAAVLTFVTTTRSAWLGFIYLFVFSLGLTALLVIVGLVSSGIGALPRSGNWTRRIKYLGGLVLIGMAEYYFVRMGSVL